MTVMMRREIGFGLPILSHTFAYLKLLVVSQTIHFYTLPTLSRQPSSVTV